MKHAYLILAHKHPTQLIQMISVLQSEKSYFYVHVDKKSGMLGFLQSMIELPKNMFVCEKQIGVNWGGFSMIQATVCLMEMLCDSSIQPDYVHLLSGQDFPLCSPQKIDEFFECREGENFINHYTLPYENWGGNGGLDRVNYLWDVDGGKTDKAQLPTRTFPDGLQPYGGSQWWSLTGQCVKWLVSVCRPGCQLYDFARYTLIPDEMFFQTAIMHSQFSGSVVNDNLRYYNWTDGPEYPRILTYEDWEMLIDSGKLFARKFDINKDAAILEKLFTYVKKYNSGNN